MGVDATVESALGEKFEIRGYPTLKFFRNGKAVEYSGGRTADTIVNWLEKKTGPAAKALDTVDAAKAFADEHDVVVVGFFKDAESDAAKAVMEGDVSEAAIKKFIAGNAMPLVIEFNQE